MSRELWEIVRVVDVVPGDVVVADSSHHPATIDKKLDTGSIAIMGGIRMWCETVFRRIHDADDPRVLRRALRLAIFALYDEKLYVPTAADPQNYIDQARRELESEGSDDQAK